MNRRIVVTVLMSAALGAPSMAAAQYSWGRPSEPQSGACFYKDPEFRGDYFCVRDGENQPDMLEHSAGQRRDSSDEWLTG